MNNLGGRPRSLTDEKQQELINRIGQGATVEESAEAVGVSLRSVQREAKENKPFAHDLRQALGSAPTDPYQLMLRAARTHWRAAAWLLERTDPDRFGKRPPHSCRPEQMMELASSLIDAALEFVPADQRELIDRHLQALADEALEAAMSPPRKSLLAAFQPAPHGYRDDKLPDWLEEALQSEDDAPPREQAEAHWKAGDLDLEADEVLSPKMRFATKPPATEPAAAVAPPVTQARDEVLSPEMHEASLPAAEPDAANCPPKRARATDRKAVHVFERNKARRERRQAARAKRKARKAA
jgi:HEPN domain-containing protein